MTYSWQIVKFDTKDLTNADGVVLSDAVVNVKWRRVGTENDNSAFIVGYTQLSAVSVAESDFTAFASLTKEAVVNWIESTMSADLIASYDATIAGKISNLDIVERARPWG